MAILGRAGAEMIPALDRGREGFSDLEKAARQAGGVMSEDDVKALADAKEESAKLSLAVTGLSNDLNAQFSPAVQGATSVAITFLSFFDRVVRGMQQWGAIEGGLPVPGGDNALALAAAASIPVPANLGGPVVHAKRQVPDFTTGRTGGKGGGKGKNDDAAEARESYQDQVGAARNAAQATIATLDDEVRQHKISWDEWAKDSTAALETEKAAIEASAQAALKSASLTSVEKMRIVREEANQFAEINRQEAKDAEKAAEETAKAWDSFFKPFNSAIESQTSALISGHERWGQAVKKTLDSLTVDMTKFFAQWILKQAEQTMAGVLGAQTVQASQTLSFGSILSTLASTVARAVSLDAGMVGAGVAANQALITGPGAVAEGLGAAAVVAGMAGGIGSADIGMWQVPTDRLSLIHQNEFIMPSAEAGAFRSMLTGAAQQGGAPGASATINPSAHFTVNALDGASVNSWMRNNAGGMAKALHEATRQGAALGLKRFAGR